MRCFVLGVKDNRDKSFLKWRVLDRGKAFTPGAKDYNLDLLKFSIMTDQEPVTVVIRVRGL